MEDVESCTAFAGERRLAAGTPAQVALAVAAALRADPNQSILAFDDQSGRQVDFDLRGSDADIAARLSPAAATPAAADDAQGKRGRPKLGVVAREVTLLPRHWDWLGDQPGGASVTLRKLVDAARKGHGFDLAAGRAKAAADRFMSTMLGNQPGYEEASRALYNGNRDQFLALSAAWPADLRDHARQLAAPAFGADA
ncbi:DUF2239 family protein [Cupriavidus pauculus]|jgi:hypothetical protein|uniref:DUF2239 family protein n=1 Tax=Cupriavidus pauculus TaxID=82633 RepID=UPI0030FCD332